CLLSSEALSPPGSNLFPYTTLFRSHVGSVHGNRPWPATENENRQPGLPATIGAREEACDFADGQITVAQRRLLFPYPRTDCAGRSEEHTSELQSRGHLVCRLLLEQK